MVINGAPPPPLSEGENGTFNGQLTAINGAHPPSLVEKLAPSVQSGVFYNTLKIKHIHFYETDSSEVEYHPDRGVVPHHRVGLLPDGGRSEHGGVQSRYFLVPPHHAGPDDFAAGLRVHDWGDSVAPAQEKREEREELICAKLAACACLSDEAERVGIAS